MRAIAPLQAVSDTACWTFSLLLAMTLRYDLSLDASHLLRVASILPLVIGAQVAAGFLLGMYRRRWRFGSFEEVLALGVSVALTTTITFAVNMLMDPHMVPRSVPLGAGIVVLVLMGASRGLWRLIIERRRRPCGSECERLLVFGAGDGGSTVIRSLLSNPDGKYLPVALLDDDVRKKNLRIMGVPVVGGRARLATAAIDYQADALLIALPSAGSALIAQLGELAVDCGLPVKVLPPVDELIGGRVSAADIRDVTASDLLGRHEIHTDVDSIAEYLTGKRVLVTGAGGSIGSELCRQIYRFAPSELMMLDRDESALHAVQLSVSGRALLDSPDVVLADLRDHVTINGLLAERRPEVVFHAAALKHLPLLERHPGEAVKTNVWATLNLLEASRASGVQRFVNISTDKAADPSSVLGYSKRLTERLAAYMARDGNMVSLSVRFGNVLGSRGSVLTTFQAQIERGGPITVTHPDVTRYFMTVEEAVELVIQAGAIGGRGEVLVLDMGEPVRIAEIARLLGSRSARPVVIHFTGLRDGEKLHEVLLGVDEKAGRGPHPLITHVVAPPMQPEAVRGLSATAQDPKMIIAQLAEMCATGTSLIQEC